MQLTATMQTFFPLIWKYLKDRNEYAWKAKNKMSTMKWNGIPTFLLIIIVYIK
jgi:hypothetical protein